MVELSRPTLPIALASGRSVLILSSFEGVLFVKMNGQLSFSTATLGTVKSRSWRVRGLAEVTSWSWDASFIREPVRGFSIGSHKRLLTRAARRRHRRMPKQRSRHRSPKWWRLYQRFCCGGIALRGNGRASAWPWPPPSIHCVAPREKSRRAGQLFAVGKSLF